MLWFFPYLAVFIPLKAFLNNTLKYQIRKFAHPSIRTFANSSPYVYLERLSELIC